LTLVEQQSHFLLAEFWQLQWEHIHSGLFPAVPVLVPKLPFRHFISVVGPLAGQPTTTLVRAGAAGEKRFMTWRLQSC